MGFPLHPETTLGVVHLYVSNIKKSLEFYTEVLRMKVLKEENTVVTFGNENEEPLLIIEEKKEAFRSKEVEQVYIIMQFYYQTDRT